MDPHLDLLWQRESDDTSPLMPPEIALPIPKAAITELILRARKLWIRYEAAVSNIIACRSPPAVTWYYTIPKPA